MDGSTGLRKREFRDIEAFDANTAVAMAIAEPGQIVKTVDGGKTGRLFLLILRKVYSSMPWILPTKIMA